MVLAGGTAYYDPAAGKNTFGYKQFPGVVTSLEFERIMSGTGPCRGQLVRAEDGKPVEKIAWIQCVGSRDLQANADFCSNICCMYAIKEAQVAKEKFGDRVDATIFYMDMRTFGKPYQRYRDEAEKVHGVRFERGRVHSVLVSDDEQSTQDLAVRYADTAGKIQEARFDMVVLSVGQRPAPGTEALAGMLDMPLNEWGFCQTEPFSMTRCSRDGIFVGRRLFRSKGHQRVGYPGLGGCLVGVEDDSQCRRQPVARCRTESGDDGCVTGAAQDPGCRVYLRNVAG